MCCAVVELIKLRIPLGSPIKVNSSANCSDFERELWMELYQSSKIKQFNESVSVCKISAEIGSGELLLL